MASYLFRLLPSHPPTLKPHSPFLSTPLSKPTYLPLSLQNTPHILLLHPTCSLSPPSTRQEAISQAKACLSATLQRPLNNPTPLPTRKLKKQRQPRCRVEIPVLDDSPASLTQLALDVFSDIPITRKGSRPTILILWPDAALLESAVQAFNSVGPAIVNSEIGSYSSGTVGSADLVVFMAPEASQLEEIKVVASSLDPRPAVLFNPKWGFEEEGGFGGGMGSFASSFDVVYSFMGLEVRGILSRRKGVVFRSARDGDDWVVMVEDEGGKGELKVVSKFKRRPSIGEVENLLYNLMAANSPVTKTVKFVRDMASNLIGNKSKE